MKFSVRVTEGAEQDLASIVSFLSEREGPALAERMLDTLLEAAAQLVRFPEQGSHPQELIALGIRDFRQFIVSPYRLIYRVSGKSIFIYLLADGRRDFRSLLERRLLRD
jgi:toxin ParE1/3/4